MRWPCLRPRHKARGIGPEYALAAGLLVTALAMSLQTLTDHAGEKLETTGDRVATGDPAPSTTAPPEPPTTTTSTTVAPTTTTTTAPTTTTTAAPTTTTTAPTTTTTAPTTTTTTATQGGVGTPVWNATTGPNDTWTGHGQYQVTSGGQAVAGAGITVRYRQCSWFFTWFCYGWTTSGPHTTGADGKVTISLPAAQNIIYLEVQVTNVTMPPGKTWDGATNTSTVVTPYA